MSVNGPFPPDLLIPQMLFLGDSAGDGLFVGIFPVFVGKNLVLIGESQYNCLGLGRGTGTFLLRRLRKNEPFPDDSCSKSQVRERRNDCEYPKTSLVVFRAGVADRGM